MIRRNFFKIAAGAVAALFVTKVVAETSETDSERACRALEEFNRRKGEFAKDMTERIDGLVLGDAEWTNYAAKYDPSEQKRFKKLDANMKKAMRKIVEKADWKPPVKMT